MHGGDFTEGRILSGSMYRVEREQPGAADDDVIVVEESLRFGVADLGGQGSVGEGGLDESLGALILQGRELEVPSEHRATLLAPEVSWEWKQEDTSLHVDLVSRIEGPPNLRPVRVWRWLIAPEPDRLVMRWFEPSGLECETDWLERDR